MVHRSRQRPRRLLAAAVVLGSVLDGAAAASAPHPTPRFVHLTQEQGLSYDTVEDIAEDPRGFMWFATADGLNRYDAHSFTVYRHDPEDPHSLSDNYVQTLLVDRSGVLWAGTLGGLNRYDRELDSFTRYRHDPEDPATLSNDAVFALHEDRAGELWVGTYMGLNRLPRPAAGRAAGTFVRYDVPRVRAVLEDRRGDLWIGTEGSGLHRLDRRSDTWVRHRHRKDDPASLSSNDVWDLFEDRQGNLWIATLDGLNRLDRAADRFVRFFHDVDDPGSLASDHLDVVFEDRRGTLWIGSDGGGLEVLDRTTGKFTSYRHDPSDETSLGSDVVRSIYEDSKGDLWVGAYTGGVNFYNRNNTAFSYYRHLANDPNSLSHNAVVSFFEDDDGTLWIGTEDGLNHFDPERRTFRRYRHDERDPGSLSADAVLAILRDSRGDLWVGTFYGGLNRLAAASATFEHYRPDADDPRSLSNPHVYDVFEDRAGQLWLGTFGGVNRFDGGPPKRAATGRDGATFTAYRHVPGDDASVGHDIVWSLYEDRAGTLWLATHDGLSRYDRAQDRFRTYRHDDQDDTSLSHDQVLAILEDREGRLWLGTEGGGLNLFDRETETFTAFRADRGLPSNVVYCILEDDAGRLWLSTNEGLTRFDPRTQAFTNYNKSDGLLAYPFARNACLRSRSGEMIFGGTHGFSSFFPERVADNPHVPPVVLTEFQVFNKPVTAGDGPLARHVTEAELIRLRHDQSVISFAFSALNYRAPDKNRYSYKLERFDKEWTEASAKRTVTYTNLDPGQYTFRVRGSNNSGLWNEEGAAVRIEVLPPYWATWWFRAASLVAAAALLAAAYSARTRSIRARNRALQAEIDERRRVEAERERLLEAMESKSAELAAKNAELESFTYTVSHDLKAPLVTIKGFLGLLEKDALAADVAQVKKDIRHIDDAAGKMHRLLDELLELSRVGRQVNEPEAVPLTDLARDAVTLLSAQIEGRGVAIDIAPAMPMVHGDRVRLLEVYQNLIGNAVKYMGAQAEPRVEVGASADGTRVLCHVRDNGMGIDPKYHAKVFGLFERLEADEEGTGVGLALVKRIVEVHGGRIWVESHGAGHGSTFYFTLAGSGGP